MRCRNSHNTHVALQRNLRAGPHIYKQKEGRGRTKLCAWLGGELTMRRARTRCTHDMNMGRGLHRMLQSAALARACPTALRSQCAWDYFCTLRKLHTPIVLEPRSTSPKVEHAR